MLLNLKCVNTDKLNDGEDWKILYRNVEKVTPLHAPEYLGKSVTLRCSVIQAMLAITRICRRSQSEFLVYMNMALIDWHSKKQSAIEDAGFGAEFVAMKTGVETLRK